VSSRSQAWPLLLMVRNERGILSIAMSNAARRVVWGGVVAHRSRQHGLGANPSSRPNAPAARPKKPLLLGAGVSSSSSPSGSALTLPRCVGGVAVRTCGCGGAVSSSPCAGGSGVDALRCCWRANSCCPRLTLGSVDVDASSASAGVCWLSLARFARPSGNTSALSLLHSLPWGKYP
jgi:hypothetical protein